MWLLLWSKREQHSTRPFWELSFKWFDTMCHSFGTSTRVHGMSTVFHVKNYHLELICVKWTGLNVWSVEACLHIIDFRTNQLFVQLKLKVSEFPGLHRVEVFNSFPTPPTPCEVNALLIQLHFGTTVYPSDTTACVIKKTLKAVPAGTGMRDICIKSCRA